MPHRKSTLHAPIANLGYIRRVTPSPSKGILSKEAMSCCLQR